MYSTTSFGWNNGIASTGPNISNKVENELLSMICMLNTWGIYGKNIQEKEKMVKDAMTRFPPTGLNDAQLKEFTTTLNDWMQNPKKYEVNCLPGSMNFKKVGGSRSGKTRKQKRRRSLKKLKSRKAH